MSVCLWVGKNEQRELFFSLGADGSYVLSAAAAAAGCRDGLLPTGCFQEIWILSEQRSPDTSAFNRSNKGMLICLA